MPQPRCESPPCEDGTVTAFRTADGNVIWQQKLTLAKYDPQNSNPGLELRAEAGIGVAQVGSGRLVGFRLADGKPLWAYQPEEETPEDAETGNSYGFLVKEGVVYALLDGKEQVDVTAG